MRAPEPVRENPNATFVLGTAPVSALLGWLISLRWTTIPAEAAAAGGTILSSVCLVFTRALARGWGVVWGIGFVPCVRRIWKGPPPT